MDFSGWEKLSLVDFDDYLTTTVFAAGCNFRCPFCHNGGLVLKPTENPSIPWESILAYLNKRRGALDAVCVSGGEPTLMPDLSNKLSQIKELGYKVKLDTNGTNPTLLKRLCGQGLVDHFAMDIKNSPRKYAETCGLKRFSLENVSESISFLMSCGVSYEFRTTLIQEFHSEEDILEIGKWISGAERYYLQRYIDSDNCISHGLHMVPKSVANQYKENLAKTIKIVDLRGYD